MALRRGGGGERRGWQGHEGEMVGVFEGVQDKEKSGRARVGGSANSPVKCSALPASREAESPANDGRGEGDRGLEGRKSVPGTLRALSARAPGYRFTITYVVHPLSNYLSI